MASVIFLKSTIGSSARRVRREQHLSQQALADLAGVSREDVDLFEHDLPVQLNIKRRLLKELWSIRASK